MPFSSNQGKDFTRKIIEKIIKFNSKDKNYKVLDIGVGCGTYSNLFRNLIPGFWTGVEIWKPYLEKYNLNQKYDLLIQDDVRNINCEYQDIVFLGDIVEHMTKDEAVFVVEKLIKNSDVIFISLPIIHYPQGEYDSNPYEAHVKDDWSHEEMLSTFGKYILESNVESEIGVYILSNNKENIKYLTRPKIAVYGIFKNEEKFITRFLDSCKEADQIVLCDTGSTDKTIHLIEEFVNDYRLWDKVIIEKITVLPWRFDNARNTALSFISPDIDLCISLDSDEYLCKNWKDILISNYDPNVSRYYHRFCSYWNDQETNKSEHWHDRIHIRSGYKWSLPVHEILERYDFQETIKWLTDFYIYQKPDMLKNRGSYLSLLELSVKERPNIWKSWSFLANEYLQIDKKQEALDVLDKAILLSDADKSFIHNSKSNIFYSMNKFNEAVNEKLLSINYSPNIREYYVYLAELYEQEFNKTNNKKLINLAISALNAAEMIIEKNDGYVYNQNCWGESFKNIQNRIQSKL